jgi:hypothetical protein
MQAEVDSRLRENDYPQISQMTQISLELQPLSRSGQAPRMRSPF